MSDGYRVVDIGGTEAVALLDAAERLIRERGFEGLVAEEAIAAGGVDLDGERPPSAWELLAAVVRRDEERFNARVDEALSTARDASGRLLALLELSAADHDWALWIELLSLALRDEEAGRLRSELAPPFRARLSRVIGDGVAAGEFRVADPEITAAALDALVDALAIEATLHDPTVSPHFMLGACAAAAGRLVGAELKLPPADA